jgi:hypothetical protein
MEFDMLLRPHRKVGAVDRRRSLHDMRRITCTGRRLVSGLKAGARLADCSLLHP